MVRVAPAPVRGWLGPLQAERLAAAQRAPKAARAPDARGAFAGKKAERLEALLVPEKVVAAHGESFAAAMKDVARLRELASAAEPWRAKQLERLLEHLYKTAGHQLDLLPQAARADAAAVMLGAFAGAATTLRDSEHLQPALFAMVSLLDSGVRLQAQKRLLATPAEAAGLVERSAEMVHALAERLRGRAGLSAAINLLPNLTEQLERAAGPLDAKGRAALWAQASELLAATVPGRGFELAAAARISEALSGALAEGLDPGGAVAAATEKIHAAGARDVKAALAVARKRNPKMPEVQRALEKVIEANPLGPAALFEALAAFRDHAAGAADRALWLSAAALVERFADRPFVVELVKRMNELVPKALGRGDEADGAEVIASLARAAAGDAHVIAREVINFKLAIKKKPLAEYPGLEAALKSLAKLEGETAILVALAVSQRLNNAEAAAPMLLGTAALAARGLGDDPWAALDGYVERFTALAAGLKDHLPEGQLFDASAKIASVTTGTKLENTEAIAELLQSIREVMPRVDLADLLQSDGRERSELLALVDPGVRYRYPPQRFLTELLGAVAKPVARNAERQLELTRLAVSLAARFGNLDGNPDLPLARVLEDLGTAVRKPDRLPAAPKGRAVDVRAAQPGLAGFIAAHPELPLELAATAGLHLGRDQLAWVSERIDGARGRDRVRSLRDFIFACVDADRMDAIDVVRRSKSTSKAVSRAITEIGREYRAGHLDRLPWDEILRGLRAGGDPIAELTRRKVEEGMAQLEPQAAAGIGAADGKAMLEKCAPAIASCLDYYKEKRNDRNADSGIDHGACIAPLEAAVKSVRNGTWPSVKYDTPVGRRLLACLTPEQEAAWRQEMITPAKGAQPVAARRAQAEGAKLLGGLAKALPMTVRLPDGLRWTRAALEGLQARRDELLDALRAVEKGSREHKELGAKLGAISRPLIALELKITIDEALAGKGGAKAALLAAKPLLPDAARALRGLGAAGAADAVEELRAEADAIRDVAQPVRFGRYAVDEDSLEALIMSHTETSGSCLNYVDGFRRWALAGSAADANIRMLRTYNGDRFSYRAFLKVFPVEMPGYKGPALWLDDPCCEGPEKDGDLDLLYRNAIRKGQAMGIPILAPSSELTDAGRAMGLETSEARVKFTIDGGNTDCMHSDHMFGGAGNLRALRGKKQSAVVETRAEIVMP